MPWNDYYGVKAFNGLGIKLPSRKPEKFPLINATDANPTKFFKKQFHGHNFNIKGYFEDYLLYKPHLKKIRSWFVPIKNKNTTDLVLHMRLGDRLFSMANYMPGQSVDADGFVKAVGGFNFKRLHIVTDMKMWGYVTPKQVEKMKFHHSFAKTPELIRLATDRVNSLVEAFKPFEPSVRFGREIASDINFMRSFDQILFQHSTLAWWAATLSNASKVGAYGPWRPTKGARNKNLGRADYLGWYSWGGH